MSTKNKSNQLSVVKSVPDVLSILRNELNSLQAISTTQYKSSGRVDGFSNSIESEAKVENLVRMWSSIKGKAVAYNEAQLDLGIVSCPAYKMNDSFPEDYKHDIQLRIKILTHAERKAELEALVKEAEGFLTREDQFALLMAKAVEAVKK